ncbi:iron ABC transporter permease, partial [Burkholderia pseudomallei]|nr:iron ABC transporter permease [Burkholderia pseudomallei]
MSLAARRHAARPISAERGSTCASRALAALRRRRARWTLAALIAAL